MAEEQPYKRQLEDDEKLENARDMRDIQHDDLSFAMQRTCDLSDEFARLEVQIATILFAFASLFLTQFRDGSTNVIKMTSDMATSTTQVLSPGGILLMKLSFAFALASLLASLIFGMIQIKSKESFWFEMLGQKSVRYVEWQDATKRRRDFSEAEAFHEGTKVDKGIVRSTANWPWILQTIFLAISVGILYTLALVFLFM